MKKVFLGLLLGLLLLPAGVLVYFLAGMAPVATSAPPMPFEKTLARIGLSSKVASEAPKNPPFTPDEQTFVAGAQLYRRDCAVCHGLPQQPLTAIAKGMYPKPPQLFKGKGVTDDPAGETYWKVANGIRLTGMPGFASSLSDQQMWQISLLLANADKLPASAHQVLVNPAEMTQAPTH
ncbi:MAG TPA: c-type cytochrome [Terriglobales bacterium]|jgi:mono/diheme cytochrome c family protein|nr:c-type cytochrome [Terriglobales bacterium]